MSLLIFSKNLKYLRKKRGMKGTQLMRKLNTLVKKEFDVWDDKIINRKRYGAYEEGRAYPPAYLLPIFYRLLRVKQKDTLLMFTTDLETRDTVPCENLSNSQSLTRQKV
jgi:transcriptional regulator with XRE-family HTH domain